MKKDENVSKEEMEKNLGNMLMAISDIAKQYKLPLEQILNDKIEDFIDTHETEHK